MSEFIIIMAICVAGVVGLMSPLVGLAMWGDYAACGSKASKMELEKSWGPMRGCMVQVDGKFMPLESYRVVKLRPAS